MRKLAAWAVQTAAAAPEGFALLGAEVPGSGFDCGVELRGSVGELAPLLVWTVAGLREVVAQLRLVLNPPARLRLLVAAVVAVGSVGIRGEAVRRGPFGGFAEGGLAGGGLGGS